MEEKKGGRKRVILQPRSILKEERLRRVPCENNLLDFFLMGES